MKKRVKYNCRKEFLHYLTRTTNLEESVEFEPRRILVAEVSGNKSSPLQEESPGQHHEYSMQKYEVDEGGFAVCLFSRQIRWHAVSF